MRILNDFRAQQSYRVRPTGLTRLAYSSLIVVFILLSSCSSDDAVHFQIAVAASAAEPVKKIITAFEKETGIKTNIVVGSSGKLSTLIQQGAPFSVFISADTIYPELLIQDNKAIAPKEIYATGQLILWCPNKNINDQHWRTWLVDSTECLAIANPKLAPYGKAAEQLIHSLHSTDATLPFNIIYGESIGQVNQFISSGACDCGFTGQSIIRQQQLPQHQWQLILAPEYNSLDQAMVLTKYGQNHQKEKATLFLQFMKNYTAKKILSEYKYIMAEK